MVQKSWDAQRLERDAERERQREEEKRVEKAETAAAAEREREIAEAEQKKRYAIFGVVEISHKIHCEWTTFFRQKVMEWKKTLLEQIEAVREKERSETAMKERTRTLLLDQKMIEDIEEKRKRAEERRKKIDLG